MIEAAIQSVRDAHDAIRYQASQNEAAIEEQQNKIDKLETSTGQMLQFSMEQANEVVTKLNAQTQEAGRIAVDARMSDQNE